MQTRPPRGGRSAVHLRVNERGARRGEMHYRSGLFCPIRIFPPLTRSSPRPAMDRTRFIDHRGHRLLLLDYTNLGTDLEQLKAEIDRSKEVIAGQPPASVLTLTDTRGSKITPG